MTQTTPAQQDGRLVWAPSPRWVQSAKRVRAFFGGQAIADSRNAHLLREGGPPLYYFPKEDVHMDLLESSSHQATAPGKGNASYWHVRVGDRVADNAAWGYQDPPEDAAFLKGFLALVWNKMDAWFEEEDEVFAHARDPFKRIDVLRTSRHIEVVLRGTVVAEPGKRSCSWSPATPCATTSPRRTCAWNCWRPATRRPGAHTRARRTTSRSGWTARSSRRSSGTTLTPTPECARISSHLCFYQEQVDRLLVDGVEQRNPKPRA